MKNLTLLIPAKNEAESLPLVLNELKNYDCKILVVLDKSDFNTVNAIKNYNCEIYYQKKSGYGGAIIDGINKIDTDYLCIFNADGSFDPKYLQMMLKKCENNYDFIFSSRYSMSGGSDDDTILTYIGNKIFTYIGNIFFKLNIDDILYTFVMGKKVSFSKLMLNSLDFCLCVELPINAKKKKYELYKPWFF